MVRTLPALYTGFVDPGCGGPQLLKSGRRLLLKIFGCGMVSVTEIANCRFRLVTASNHASLTRSRVFQELLECHGVIEDGFHPDKSRFSMISSCSISLLNNA